MYCEYLWFNTSFFPLLHSVSSLCFQVFSASLTFLLVILLKGKHFMDQPQIMNQYCSTRSHIITDNYSGLLYKLVCQINSVSPEYKNTDFIK